MFTRPVPISGIPRAAARGIFVSVPCYTCILQQHRPGGTRIAMDYHILIVDDEKELCLSLSEILTEEGYPTLYTSDPLETPAILARARVDLIILDIRMPGHRRDRPAEDAAQDQPEHQGDHPHRPPQHRERRALDEVRGGELL